MTLVLIAVFIIGFPLALLGMLLWVGAVCLVRYAGFKALIAASLAIMAASAMAWDYLELHLALNPVPDALEVSSVLYSKEELWGTGFSGGDSETGLRVFLLDADVARQIERQGIRYLDAMRPDSDTTISGHHGDKWRNAYTDWVRTPMPAAILSSLEETRTPSLHTFLASHGYGIDIDPVIATRVDTVLQSPGSYYAKGRVGYLVISPRERLVIYMYVR